MKNLVTAVLFSFILSGVSLAQTVVKAELDGARADKSTKPRIAVLEFADEAKIGADGIQALQNGIAASLRGTGKFRVVEGEQLNAAVRNGNLQITQVYSGAAAVKIGKLLGVNYVLTGAVTEYNADRMAIKVQLVDVNTGRLGAANTYRGLTMVSDGTMNQSASNTWTGSVTLGSLSATEKVMKPVIQQLTASLKAADL